MPRTYQEVVRYFRRAAAQITLLACFPCASQGTGQRSTLGSRPAQALEKIGGEGRTRTFEAMRRLIYSQLPLPLGTLPLSTTSRPAAEMADIRPRMTLKPRTRHRHLVGRVYGGITPAKSTKAGR